MKTASALIYDSYSLKKISTKLPVKLLEHDLLIFKCALEKARKDKTSLSKVTFKKIDAEDLKMNGSYTFFQTMARSAKISIGHKSCLALALCAEKGFLLVTADQCIINLAASSEVPYLHI